MIDEQEIRSLSESIAEEFHPDRIILFGSYATGRSTPDSDVDLLLILSFEGRDFTTSVEILNRINYSFP